MLNCLKLKNEILLNLTNKSVELITEMLIWDNLKLNRNLYWGEIQEGGTVTG